MSKQLIEDILHTDYQVIGSGAGAMLKAWPITAKEIAKYAAELQAENARLAAELAALTPGGSEFHNLPDNCLQWIRERLKNRAKVAKERNQLRAELAAARERITRLENWVREEGDRGNTCTYDILNKKICNGCLCGRLTE